MMLSDRTIAELAQRDPPMISPFVSRKIIHAESGLSFGLQPASYDFRIREDVILRPRSSLLASTLEEVVMPNDVSASVADKSSWARRFVTVCNTFFDPGFRGVPTIEIINHSHEMIEIASGTPICQFKFFALDRPCAVAYDGKYQDQPAMPVEWIKEKVKP